MADVVLLLWVWMIAGCFSLYAHSASLREDVDLASFFFLVLAWPWWLSQRKHRHDHKRGDVDHTLAPIRIETSDDKARRR